MSGNKVVEFVDEYFGQMCKRPIMSGTAEILEFQCFLMMDIRRVALGLELPKEGIHIQWSKFIRIEKKIPCGNLFFGSYLMRDPNDFSKLKDIKEGDPRPEEIMMVYMKEFWDRQFPIESLELNMAGSELKGE